MAYAAAGKRVLITGASAGLGAALARRLAAQNAVVGLIARRRNRLSEVLASNAFGFEEVDGQHKHTIAHYLDLVAAGRVDLRPTLTHTFALEQWRDAFLAIANQGESGAIKVAIDQR
jgi:NAD(P)-dependent dehydrogenase (short-subunit alcohol dehydrogenase family)